MNQFNNDMQTVQRCRVVCEAVHQGLGVRKYRGRNFEVDAGRKVLETSFGLCVQRGASGFRLHIFEGGQLRQIVELPDFDEGAWPIELFVGLYPRYEVADVSLLVV